MTSAVWAGTVFGPCLWPLSARRHLLAGGHHRSYNGSETCALKVDASLGSKHCCLAQANNKSSKQLQQSIVQMRVLAGVLDILYSHEQKHIWISNTPCY